MKNSIFFLGLIIIPFFFSCTDEGDLADLTDDREQFIGTWNVQESCSKDAYTVQITKDPSNSAQVIISNFWHITNCENPPYAIIAGNSIYLPSQYICNGTFDVKGDGDLNKQVISWSYTVNDGADLYSCTAEYTRQ
ncbi:MAG: hypothetical protein K9G76_10975 [Bacteroidales bacterium]|nr:hypothetical protein [Bacteroidales bacterium]MCF8404915.1 hypothetical protein [Bacteroidales bacterium]